MAALRQSPSQESKKAAAKREILRRPLKDDFHEQREHQQKHSGILRRGSATTEPEPGRLGASRTDGAVTEVFRKIAVPTDFSPSARRAVDVAVELATRLSAELVVVHCVEPSIGPTPEARTSHAAARKALDAELERVRGTLPSAQRRLLFGGAVERITAFVDESDIDLLVLAKPERGASRSLLGNAADEVTRASRVAVLTVRD